MASWSNGGFLKIAVGYIFHGKSQEKLEYPWFTSFISWKTPGFVTEDWGDTPWLRTSPNFWRASRVVSLPSRQALRLTSSSKTVIFVDVKQIQRIQCWFSIRLGYSVMSSRPNRMVYSHLKHCVPCKKNDIERENARPRSHRTWWPTNTCRHLLFYDHLLEVSATQMDKGHAYIGSKTS